MTNEEAIMYLQDIKKGKYQQYPLEQNEALDLAIKALEEGDYEAGWMDGYNHALDQTFKELNYLVKNHVLEELRKKIKR